MKDNDGLVDDVRASQCLHASIRSTSSYPGKAALVCALAPLPSRCFTRQLAGYFLSFYFGPHTGYAGFTLEIRGWNQCHLSDLMEVRVQNAERQLPEPDEPENNEARQRLVK